MQRDVDAQEDLCGIAMEASTHCIIYNQMKSMPTILSRSALKYVHELKKVPHICKKSRKYN